MLPLFKSASARALTATVAGGVARQSSRSSVSLLIQRGHAALASQPKDKTNAKLTHVDSKTGSAHMVDISNKDITSRTATATARVLFSNPEVTQLIRDNSMRKGDVLATARIAGIMAAKRTSELIPLCHPIGLTKVAVDLEVVSPNESDSSHNGQVNVTATVSCSGKTGVEMEALTAASTAALTIYDMCKAVDKMMVIQDIKVTFKEGGKSGTFDLSKKSV